LGEDDVTAESTSSGHSLHSDRAIVSTKEKNPEDGEVGDEASSLSAERFQQRTEVFESLVVFVGENAKQPSGNLLDMMHGVEDDM
jgi:hypothetical protein